MLDLTTWNTKEIIDVFKRIDLVKSVNRLKDHKLDVIFNDTHRVYLVSLSTGYEVIGDNKLLITYMHNQAWITLEHENLPNYILNTGIGLIIIFDEQPQNKSFSDLLRERTIEPVNQLLLQEWNSKYGKSKNKKGK